MYDNVVLLLMLLMMMMMMMMMKRMIMWRFPENGDPKMDGL